MQSILELVASGRSGNSYLWFLMQCYLNIPKKLRRQARVAFVWYPKERTDLKIIHDENNVPKDHEFVTVRDFLKSSKHVYTYKMNITVDLGK